MPLEALDHDDPVEPDRNPSAWLRAFVAVCITFLPVVATSASAQSYQLVDLGSAVVPQDVNGSDDVVGWMTTPAGLRTAFVYSLGSSPLPLPGTIAWAINDAGRIVGETAEGAFVMDRGTTALAFADVGAFGVSESGLASGNVARVNPYRESPLPRAPALYDGNAWSWLDVAGVYRRGRREGIYADVFVLWDVNDAGVAVGSRRRTGLVGSAAILVPPDFDSFEFLPIPHGGSAFAINAMGDVVGATGEDSATGIFEHAFHYETDTGAFTDLGTLGGLRSRASDVNDSGRVVGASGVTSALSSIPQPLGEHAFVWHRDTGLVDLNDLVDAPGYVLTSATAINDAGDIVGTAYAEAEGEMRGYLLRAQSDGDPTPGDVAPIAVATADVTSGPAPLEVRFDGSGSKDPDGWGLTLHWTFGDGTTSSEPSPTHVYSSAGTFVAVLSVEDADGLVDSAEVEITVRGGSRTHGKKK